MTNQEFYDACAAFDWFYEMSDDNRVFTRGEAAQTKLLSGITPEQRGIWVAFCEHHYSGPQWGTEKKPKPERP